MRRLFRLVLIILVAIVVTATATSLLKEKPIPHYHKWKHGIPVGFSMSDFQHQYLTEGSVRGIEAKEYAAKTFWHANTIRFQIVQDRLVGRYGTQFDAQYFDYIIQAVDYGRALGLNIVINAQTEWSRGYHYQEPMPDHTTHVFWRIWIERYKNTPHVIFDLFNEPRGTHGWPEWQSDMQSLVNEIRGSGAHNQIWVNGMVWGSTLEGVPLLHGKNIVYTYHHPADPWEGSTDQNVNEANWDKAFGYLAEEKIPVVDAEFPNYGKKPDNYVWNDMGKTVPEYLRYLQKRHIGLIAWSLQKGTMNSTDDPTSLTHAPNGDGAIVHRWFDKLWREGKTR